MPNYREFPNQLRQIALHKKDNRWRFQQSVSRLTVRAINSQTKLWICNDLNKDIGTCAIINSNILKCNVISICHLLLKQAPEIECKVASSLYSFVPFVGAPKNVSSFLLSTWSLLYVFWINAHTHTHKCSLALMYAHQCTYLSTYPHPYTNTLVHTSTHYTPTHIHHTVARRHFWQQICFPIVLSNETSEWSRDRSFTEQNYSNEWAEGTS